MLAFTANDVGAEWDGRPGTTRALLSATSRPGEWDALRNALRGLVAAAEPLCGKPEVIPGRIKLPPEFYPAALPAIQVLREAVDAARTALANAEDSE